MPLCSGKQMFGGSPIEDLSFNPPWGLPCPVESPAVTIAAGTGTGIHSEWTRGVLRRAPAAGRGGCCICLVWRFGTCHKTS